MTNIPALLEDLNTQVFGVASRMVMQYVAIDDLREQDVNANAMPVEMFNALVSNLKREGHAESIPLVANREGKDQLEIVSGHHRVRAMRRAGQTNTLVFRYKDLTQGEIRAKQLSHNSIAGESDPQIVKQLFESIQDIDLKVESFIDPATMIGTPKPVPFKPITVDPLLCSKTVTVVFLNVEANDFAKALELLHPKTDSLYVAHRDAFEGFRAAVKKVRKDLDIKSIPTAIATMADLAVQQLNVTQSEQEGENDHG